MKPRTFEQHLAFLLAWAQRDKGFAWKQANRDEAQYPGIAAALTEAMLERQRFFDERSRVWSNSESRLSA